ncbi:hypothetical protein EON63_16360 [archaeon]|nr:MAG: hypothetical protein EON63_16360 [archaeon]
MLVKYRCCGVENLVICKYLVHLKINPGLAWTNELKEDKADACLIKAFVAGCLKVKLLYSQVHHYGLPIFTANTIVNVKMDSGVRRRMIGYKHQSIFISVPKLVDEANHVNMTDLDFLDNLNDEMLNAIVSILADYARRWI